MNLLSILSNRKKKYYLSPKQKERIGNYIRLLYQTEPRISTTSPFRTTPPLSVFLGGSHSCYTPKLPKADSDVDIYVFVAGGEPIKQSESKSMYATKSLGHQIQIFEVNQVFMNEVIKGMEQI